MNCKPGDLAVIVRSIASADVKNLGRVFLLTQISVEGTTFSGSPCWETEEMEPDFVVRDDCLRPIRPQDDDAEDQSKAWLPPVPTREIA